MSIHKKNEFKIVIFFLSVYFFIPIKWELMGISAPYILIIFTFLTCILLNQKIVFYKEFISFSVILYFGVMALLYLRSFSIIQYVKLFIGYFLVFYLLVAYIDTTDKFFKALDIISKVFLIYSIFGIFEALTKVNVFDLLFNIIDNNTSTMIRFGILRPKGANTMTINNCIVLNFATILITYYMSISTTIKKSTKISYILVVINGLLTLSRGAMVLLIVTQCFIGMASGYVKNKRKILIATEITALSCILIEVLNLQKIKNMILQLYYSYAVFVKSNQSAKIDSSFGANPNGIGHRGLLFTWVTEKVGKQKWFGLGVDAVFSQQISTSTIKTSIENYYLATYFRFGYIGVAVFLITIFLILIYLLKWSKRKVSFEKNFNINTLLLAVIPVYLGILLSVSATDDLRMLVLTLAFAVIRNRLCKNQSTSLLYNRLE